MYWWDRAAEILADKGAVLRRFGLVTTNSITQEFSRRIIKKRTDGKHSVSLVLAINDHPWTKATDEAAQVRIAMTVCTAGEHEGILREVIRETDLDTDQPRIEFREIRGRINSDLTVGSDAGSALPLRANDGLSSRGMMLFGSGFIVTRQEAEMLGLGKRKGLNQFIRPYLNGRDLNAHSRNLMVIDFFGLTSNEVKNAYPEAYQHLLENVKPERDRNRDKDIKSRWWLFGRTRDEIRPALEGLNRYIATVETSKHRVLQFLPIEIVPDNMIVCVASEDAFVLGILSSRIHVIWALRAGGWLGVGNDPRYSKSKVFDPFPFPSPGEIQKSKVRTAVEELDAFRKQRQKEHPDLTLTQMYNVLEKLKANAPLDENDEAIKDKGLILILKEHHEKLDTLVFEAYGWPQTLTDEQILEKLVALNRERAAEEKRGHVRWLRPDYQIPRFGQKLDKQAAKEQGAQVIADLGLPEPGARKPSFPTDAVAQTAAVFAALASAREPMDAGTIAASFRKSKNLEVSISKVLQSLARLGHAFSRDGERFEIRRVA